MFRPALGLIAAGFLLSACGGMMQGEPQPVVAPNVALPPPVPQGPPHVALLLPLTGPNAGIAQAMNQAAQLAASAPGSPLLDIRDTGGDPSRAAAQAQAAIAAGDSLILGPLTAEETQAVSAVAVPANIAVLSFSSDPSVAIPGVWPLGVTPGQQMRRLIAAARDEGRQHIAALLPEGAFGDAMQLAITDAASQVGLEAPNIQRGGADPASLETTLKLLTNYEARHGDLERRIKAMRDSTDPADRQRAALLAAEPVAPPPFDTLVLASKDDMLHMAAEMLPDLGVIAPQVRVLGPSFWAADVSHLGRLAGAWYALPDASQRDGFVQAYANKYGAPPPPLADIAFDAALIGRSLAGDHDFSTNAITKPDGFAGVDGALVLLPDGHVRRALAIYQIQPDGGVTIVSPAPSDLSSPGS